jgi:hypothetical protein
VEKSCTGVTVWYMGRVDFLNLIFLNKEDASFFFLINGVFVKRES